MCLLRLPIGFYRRSRTDWQLVGDHDRFLPASMASGSQPNLSSADGSAVSRERALGALRPSRGAEDVYAQARTLFRAMVQLPHYAEEVRVQMLWRKHWSVLRLGQPTGRATAAKCQGGVNSNYRCCDRRCRAPFFLLCIAVTCLHLQQIGEILCSSLEDYFALVQNKFQDVTVNR